MGFYTESVDRPYTSGLVSEDVDVGTLAADDGSGGIRRAEATDNRIDYLAAKHRRGAYNWRSADDDLTSFTYESADNDRAPLQPLVDGDVIKAHTAQDNGTDPAANITNKDIVGIAGVGGTEFEGRLVESGYTDNAGTVYSESGAGDFLKLGKAYRDSASSFDAVVRVQVNRENLQ
jgi:hypothetical protein